ncbi:MAG: hypothetical protein ABEJ76_04650 [Halanaeroarchaeum sp.]
MGRSRGQVIVVAALGIAVTLVALALITNTVIYTQNLATRETADAVDPVAYQQSSREAVGGLLALANRYNATDHESIATRFRNDVENYSATTAIEAARNGRLAVVSVTSVTNGTRIFQNASRNFTDDDGNVTWTLANDVDRVRRFELNVTQDELTESSPFEVVVTNGSAEWTATIEQNGTDGAELVLENDTTTETCTVNAEHAVVDLTEGTLAGRACDGPTFAAGVSPPYDVEFHNASNGHGRYVLFVEDTSISDENYHGAPYTENPNEAPAVYSATVHLTMRRPDLIYETNLTVAPEDSPEDGDYGVVP